MAKKKKRYADDGWAVWIDGDDVSTVYINDWLNPKGISYVDIAVRIRGVKASRYMKVYIPFSVTEDEIEDVSLKFNDRKILQATFSAACIVDYMKNEYTSEIAYNRKTIDIVHISALGFEVDGLDSGTVISVDLKKLSPFLDNDEAYFIWRMPHKSLNEIFKPNINVDNFFQRLRDLITTPVVSEKYGYSIRVNEARLLPEEITGVGAFHRQKLKKAVVSITIDENYEMNDSGCYRISRLEEDLYRDYRPEHTLAQEMISYQWIQTRDYNQLGHFSFYNTISRNSVSGKSMLLYLAILLAVGVFGDLVSSVFRALINLSM